MERIEVSGEQRLATLADHMSLGDEVVIMRDGTVVAEVIVKPKQRRRATRPRALDLEALNELRRNLRLSPGDGASIIRDLRDGKDW